MKTRGKKYADRGAVELGVLLAAGSLLLGLVFGNGIARQAVELFDGMTWLGDDTHGEVLQVNPATGRPEVRLGVGAPGSDLVVHQADGLLVVHDRTAGTVTSYDLATLLAAGSRQVEGGGATKVLLGDEGLFVVDRSAGTVASVDPLTTDPRGRIWSAGGAITDAVLATDGGLWVLGDDARLWELRWRGGSALSFDAGAPEQLAGVDSRTVLVPHEEGTTLFAPGDGVVARRGTGADLATNAPALRGTVLPALHSPADLAPAAVPDAGVVVLVGSDAVREIDVAAIGCAEPGAPAVFHRQVYVPCTDAQKVIRLAPDGGRAGPDIALAEPGAVELVIDDDRLTINVDGARTGVQVLPDGRTRTIIRRDDATPRVDPGAGARPQVDPPAVDDVVDRDRTRARDRREEPPPWRADDVLDRSRDRDRGQRDRGQGDRRQRDRDRGARTPGPGTGTDPGPGTGDPTGDPTPTDPDPTDPDPTDPDPTDPDPTDPPLPAPDRRAPSGVAVTPQPDGALAVSWQHAGDPADGFRVHTVDGPSAQTAVGSASRSAVLRPATVGTPTRVVVTALFADTELASAPSGPATPYGRPGAPRSVTASAATHWGNGSTRVTVSWSAAAPNGAAVTAYEVRGTGGTPSTTRTTTVSGTSTGAVLDFTCSAGDPLDCGHVGQVEVTAVNTAGTGPAASATPAETNAKPPALPTGGAQHLVAGGGNANIEGMGTARLTLAPPASWAAFTGTCRYTHHGNNGGPSTGTLPCGATSLTLQIAGPMYIREPDDGVTTHSIVFTADNGWGTATSVAGTFEVRQPTLCEGCQIP